MNTHDTQTLRDALSWVERAYEDHPDCPGASYTAYALRQILERAGVSRRMIDDGYGKRVPRRDPSPFTADGARYFTGQDFQRRGLLAAHKATDDEHSRGL